MDINTALSSVVVLGQVGMFFFFKQQLKSKNKIIEDFKVLIDTTDIKRLAVYYKTTDELREKAIQSKLELESDNVYKEHYAKMGRQYDELATFIETLIIALPKNERAGFIERHIPSCNALYAKYIQDGQDNTKIGSSDNP